MPSFQSRLGCPEGTRLVVQTAEWTRIAHRRGCRDKKYSQSHKARYRLDFPDPFGPVMTFNPVSGSRTLRSDRYPWISSSSNGMNPLQKQVSEVKANTVCKETIVTYHLGVNDTNTRLCSRFCPASDRSKSPIFQSLNRDYFPNDRSARFHSQTAKR